MPLSLWIALRYVFGKKTTNAINIISAISVAGLAIGTASLILVLSVFNGLHDLITGMFSTFNPDVKILPVKGKTFDPGTLPLDAIKDLPGVSDYTLVLEDLALFEYDGVQAFGTLKGVDEAFTRVSRVAGSMYSGSFQLLDGGLQKAVAGLGIADRMSLNIYDPYAAIRVYAPRHTGRRLPGDQPFISRNLSPAGIFAIQQDFDNEYVLSSLDFAREVFQRPGQVSALEIRLSEGRNQQPVIDRLRELAGPAFRVLDRYEQDEAFLKLQRLEKWVSFIILSLTLFLVAFNLVGALWMIVREKARDIALLKALGFSPRRVRSIFLYAGGIYALLGTGLGVALALVLYWLQKEWALVRIPDGFAVTAYPVSLSLADLLIVAATVLLIGMLAALPAAWQAQRMNRSLREN